MLRYNRSRYLAMGLPGIVNAILLPLYAFKINTGGSHDEYAAPFYLAIAMVCALLGATAMIKRARDIGSSAWGILLGFMFAPPLMALVALVLIFVPSNPAADQLEAPSSKPSWDIWLADLILLLLPWLLVLVLRIW
jgi:uncharacterized membrane protein YhaH (DUF805 family)